ncbi:MAG: PLP-dependent aminotransferase family protein [Acidobacteriota bacterium]
MTLRYRIGMVHLDEPPLALDRASSVPLYQQVREGIARAIREGKIPPGTRLPASRELAQRLQVNRTTITTAYDSMAAEGLVRRRVGQGTFVLGGPRRAVPPSVTWPFSRAVEAVSRQPRPPAALATHPDPVDFASLVPDEELFPIEPFRKVMNAVLRRDGKQLLQYGSVSGYTPFRECIAERLNRRGVAVTVEDVLIVNGSQQGLDVVFRTLLDPGDMVAVESPTYSAVLPLLAQYQAQLKPVPMSQKGMDLNALETALVRRPVKLIYTMPTFQNPTGITMDLDSRRKLLDLTRRYQVPIVEDDFDPELRFGGKALPPLKALDEAGLVLYLGTFSKGLFPGLRLGWIVAPPAVVEALRRTKMFADYHTSALLQAGVLEFCRRGHYDDHLRRLAGIYREKSQHLVRAMSRHFPPEVSWTAPEGGYAFWISLPEGVSAEALLAESEGQGVLFTPGNHFFLGGEGERFFRLSISRVPAHRIEEGVRRLGDIIRNHAASKPAPSRRQANEPVFQI